MSLKLIHAPIAAGSAHSLFGAITICLTPCLTPVMATILIVDDDSAFRTSLCRMLGAEGYTARCVADGATALQVMKAETPCLVLLDYMMPGLSGLEVLRAIRAEPALAEVPIVMLTAVSHPNTEQEAIRCGANSYLVKGLDWPESLLRVVNRFIDPGAAVAAIPPAGTHPYSEDLQV